MRHLNTLSKLFGVITLIGGMTLALPLVANAATPANGSGTYCVASTSSNTPVQCFSTFEASISYATQGRVSLANATDARYVSPSELGSNGAVSPTNSVLAPASNVVLAIDYSGSSYTGSSLVWTGTGCSATVGGANMPSSFNDKTRSVAAYSGCATTLFANANYGSPAYLIGVNGAVSDMGSFDDTASSQLFCNYYGCA